jgi:uncharacterized protein YkwD
VGLPFVVMIIALMFGFPQRGAAQGEDQIVEMQRIINLERHKLEKPMLVMSNLLSRVAQDRARELALKDSSEQDDSAKSTLRERILATKVPFLMVAEMISRGKRAPRDAFDRLMLDKKNWAKMFRKEYTQIGIGYVADKNAKYRHYWVIVLGTPKEEGGGK